MSESAVHPPLVAGIYGRKGTGARSVVLAGHFPDEDYGDHLCVSTPFCEGQIADIAFYKACMSGAAVENLEYVAYVCRYTFACSRIFQLRFGPQTCDQNFDNALNESLRVRPLNVIVRTSPTGTLRRCPRALERQSA